MSTIDENWCNTANRFSSFFKIVWYEKKKKKGNELYELLFMLLDGLVFKISALTLV